jgi:hypothetical protein
MSRLVRALLAALAGLIVTAAPASADVAGSGPVQISQQTTTAHVGIGQRFAFTTTIRNDGDRPLSGLVAHLDIVGLDPDVYVDPEDWSTQRTQYPSAVPPHATTRLSWSVHAVTTGRLVLYVSLVSATGQAVAAGPALHAEVGAQQRLDPNGVLPVAVGVPVLLLALLAAARLRRRRLV